MTPLGAITFFACLAFLATLIWGLSLVSSFVSNRDADQATKTAKKQYLPQKGTQDPINQHLVTIKNVIETYREECNAQDRQNTKRDKITVFVLVLTAIFAAAAAVAAGVSAWIFQGQLDEIVPTCGPG